MLVVGALIALWVGKDSGFLWARGAPSPPKSSSDEQPPKVE
jgi:hypothetical protein